MQKVVPLTLEWLHLFGIITSNRIDSTPLFRLWESHSYFNSIPVFFKGSRKINFYLNSCFKIQHAKSTGLFWSTPFVFLVCSPCQIHTSEAHLLSSCLVCEIYGWAVATQNSLAYRLLHFTNNGLVNDMVCLYTTRVVKCLLYNILMHINQWNNVRPYDHKLCNYITVFTQTLVDISLSTVNIGLFL